MGVHVHVYKTVPLFAVGREMANLAEIRHASANEQFAAVITTWTGRYGRAPHLQPSGNSTTF
jgi:hypothetical protein